MESIDWDEVGKALLRRAAVIPLEKYIKEPFQEVMTPLLTEHEIFPSYPGDAMMVLIFTHIDLLGYLYKGASSSRNAVEFLRDYLGRADTRYKEVGGLLYVALRHGWIHKVTPKRFELRDGTILDFSWGSTKNRAEHLKMKKDTIERREVYRLFISLPLLYEDLVSAIDLYAEDLRHNQELLDIFKEAFETRREPEKEEKVRRRNYIKSSDFDFIYQLLAG